MAAANGAHLACAALERGERGLLWGSGSPSESCCWAFCSLLRSVWAREFYDGRIAAGKCHHAALRALSNRWLEILWHGLTKGVQYDETVHVANRNRALGHAA